jgi:hypothetical protein
MLSEISLNWNRLDGLIEKAEDFFISEYPEW